jgi:SNF2 family DNA or RNA helicase
MGLGKTLQTIAFIAGLFHSDAINAVLIVAPVSVLPVWEAELRKWSPEIRVRTFHGAKSKRRDAVIARIMRRGGVVLTTYGMCTSSPQQLGATGVTATSHGDVDDAAGGDDAERGAPGAAARDHDEDDGDGEPSGSGGAIVWDLLVLDEGHKIKNASTQVNAEAGFVLTCRAVWGWFRRRSSLPLLPR